MSREATIKLRVSVDVTIEEGTHTQEVVNAMSDQLDKFSFPEMKHKFSLRHLYVEEYEVIT